MICTDFHIDLMVDPERRMSKQIRHPYIFIDNATSSYLALYTMIRKVET
jgi:hypothetical protein